MARDLKNTTGDYKKMAADFQEWGKPRYVFKKHNAILINIWLSFLKTSRNLSNNHQPMPAVWKGSK